MAEDPRLLAGIAHFNEGDFDLAADAFEELYFEAVRDEVEFIRVLMQVATGIHHVERNQFRAAIERLQEGVRAVDAVTNDRGYDFARLRADMIALLPKIVARSRGAKERIEWPKVSMKPEPASPEA
jgi:predicted metal-dependent hydrolase